MAAGTNIAALGVEIQTADAATNVRELTDANNQLGESAVRTGEAVDGQQAKLNAGAAAIMAHERAVQQAAQAEMVFSRQVQEVLARFDPLGAKLRSLQADFAALEREVMKGAGAGQELAIDKAYASLNAEIAKTKQLMEQAGAAGAEAGANIERGGLRAAFATQAAKRELIVLGHEALQGNFSRMPGSFMVLAERMNITAALFNPITIGLAAVAAGAVGLLVAAHNADEFAGAMQRLQVQLEATGRAGTASAKDLGDMVKDLATLSGVDSEAAQKAVAALARVHEISGPLFHDLVGLSADFAAAIGEDVPAAAKALGAAFADPAKGAQKLHEEYGLLRTESVLVIQEMVRHNDVAGAQQRLLEELASTVQGLHRDSLTPLQAATEDLAKSWRSLDQALSSGNGMGFVNERLTFMVGEIKWIIDHAKQFADAVKTASTDPMVQFAAGQGGSGDAVPSPMPGRSAAAGGAPAASVNPLASPPAEEWRRSIDSALKLGEAYKSTAEKTRELKERGDSLSAAMKALRDHGEANTLTYRKLQDQYNGVQEAIDRANAKGTRSSNRFDNAVFDEELKNIQRNAQAYRDAIEEQEALRKAANASELQDLQHSYAMRETTERQFRERQAELAVAAAQAQVTRIDDLIAVAQNKRDQDVGLQGQAATIEQWRRATEQIAKDEQDLAKLEREREVAVLRIGDAMRAEVQIADQMAQKEAAFAQATAKSWGDFLLKTRDVNEQWQFEASLINKTTTEQVALTAARAEDLRIRGEMNRLTAEFDAANQRGDSAEKDRILERINLLDRMKQGRMDDAATAAASLAQQRDLIASQQEAWSGVEGVAKSVWDNVANGGHDAFRNIGEDIKRYVLDMLYQLTLRKWVLQIGANVTGNAGLAQTAGMSGQGSLLGAGGGLGNVGGLASGAAGLFGASDFTAAAAGDAFLPAALGAEGLGAASIGSTLGAGLASVASFIPYVGAAIAVISLVSGLFGNKDPSKVKGQFGVSTGTAGFEDNAFTASKFGNLGFLDANTQQFSGEAAQVFNRIVSGALDAFSSRMSADQSARLADILQNTTFASAEGTFTTQDFLQKYGGQVLQQVVTAAFDVLDPALGSVVANFKGTADEVSAFANTLLSIHDATKGLDPNMAGKINAALTDATQATADKVLVFANVLTQFGDSVDGWAQQAANLDPANITKFIDALGGAQAAAQGFAYLAANFLPDSERKAQEMQTLTDTFARFGLEVPKNHQAFLDDLAAIDLNTDAGRNQYAMLMSVSGAFVDVFGTAQSATAALEQEAEANRQLIESAQDYYNERFFSEGEKATQRIAHAWDVVHDAWTENGQQLLALGYDHIPTTNAGFRQMIDDVDRVYGSTSDLHNNLILVAPTIDGLNTDIGSLADAAEDAGDKIAQAAQQINVGWGAFISAGEKLADQMQQGIDTAIAGLDFGDALSKKVELTGSVIASLQQRKIDAAMRGIDDPSIDFALNKLQGSNQAAATYLAQYTTLTAQYDAKRAAELVQLQQKFDQDNFALMQAHAPAAVLAALHDNFNKQWQDIINGTSTGVDGVVDQLQRLRQNILDYVDKLKTGPTSALKPQQRIDEAQRQYEQTLALARTGDQDALGKVTQLFDTFYNLEREFNASSPITTQVFNQGIADLTALGLGQTTPTSTDSLLASALPRTSTLASADDIKTATTTIVTSNREVIAALANSNTADSREQIAATTSAARITTTTAKVNAAR